MANQGNSNNGRRVRPRRQELSLIQNEAARQVSFSKRRAGLFTKASEIAILCGAEVALLVNSPAGRPYTFGSPAVDPIFHRFLSNNPNQPNQGAAPFNIEHHQQQAMISKLNKQNAALSTQLDAVRFRRTLLNDRLKRAAEAAPECNWCEKIDQLQIDELRRLIDILSITKERLMARNNEIDGADHGASSSSIVNSSGQQLGLVIGNNNTFLEGSHPTESYSVQADQTDMSTSQQIVLSSIPPSLINSNSGVGVDLSFNPGLALNYGGANNALMPPLSGLISFGSFTYNQGNENPNAGNTSNNNSLFFDPNAFVQSQSNDTSNPPMPYNFNSSTFQLDTPLGRANYGSNQINYDSLASLVWPSSSISQGQYFWGTDSFGQNMHPGLGLGTLDQAGPSNPGMNNYLLPDPEETNIVDSEETDPGATRSEQGPR